MKYCFGVDVGGTTVKLGFFSEDSRLIEKWEITTRKEEDGVHILPDIAQSLKAKMKEHGIVESDVLGIGIGVPGPVTKDGVVHRCINLGWGILNVEEALGELMNIPVKAGNDANVAALGEAWQGGGKGYENVVMVTLGTGVGGGIILDGKILTGTKGAAGEIGHILVNYDEKEYCNCGKTGCLEQYASATGIVRVTQAILAESTKPSTLRDFNPLTAKDIFDQAKDGDELANDAVNQLCRYLGIALSHIAEVVDPEAFVIGGGVSKAGEILTTNISKYYNEFAMVPVRNKTFCLALLGNDAGIYGCAKMAMNC